MRRNTQRLYESIMKVVDRSVRKALSETYLPTASESNIQNILYKIRNNEKVSDAELKQLDSAVAIYKVKNKMELQNIVDFYSNEHPNVSLNWVDVSGITDMSELFAMTKYNGDISQWDVSNVRDMSSMFRYSRFNHDISVWDVSNVTNMYAMFYDSEFNQDISQWDVSNVMNMSMMFCRSVFNGHLAYWDVSNVENMREMFAYSMFNQDISKWNVNRVRNSQEIFYKCRIKDSYKPIQKQPRRL